MNLFQLGSFFLHSGSKTLFKIDCDALTDSDWKTLAHIAIMEVGLSPFSKVVGIPRGGLAFARALEQYKDPSSSLTLIVDNVLTTGESFVAATQELSLVTSIIGVVAFALGEAPSWVTVLFNLERRA